MARRSIIFISATSADLGAARDLVAKILLSLGYDADWQDLNATEGGSLLDILRAKVDRADAVLQLVGSRYGEEPPQAVEPFGRVSYTQFEALYAESIKKKVVYIFLPGDYPAAAVPPESADKVQLQDRYRESLTHSGALRHSAHSALELENRVLRFRDELGEVRAELQRQRRRSLVAFAVVTALLVGVGAGVGGLHLLSRRQETQLADLRSTAAGQSQTLDTLQNSAQQQRETLVTLETAAARQGVTVDRIEAKVEELRNLPLGTRMERLADALTSANSRELELLTLSGVGASQVESVLARTAPGGIKSVAEEFFERSRNSPDCQDWFRQALAAGVNPNLLLPREYYEQGALIHEAQRAGNTQAMLSLLEAGASPHGYQNLWLTAYPTPRFLFPYNSLAEDSRFTLEQKRQIATAYRDHGAALFRYEPGMAPEEVTYQADAIETMLSNSGERLGVELQEAEFQIANSPLGPRTERDTGVKWSEFTAGLPRRVVPDSDLPLSSFEVRHFIGSFADKFYFLGVARHYLDKAYVLIEVSKDRINWHVYVFMNPAAGMGLAKPTSDGFRPERAWRRYNLVYAPGKNTMRLSDYYDCKVESNWP